MAAKELERAKTTYGDLERAQKVNDDKRGFRGRAVAIEVETLFKIMTELPAYLGCEADGLQVDEQGQTGIEPTLRGMRPERSGASCDCVLKIGDAEHRFTLSAGAPSPRVSADRAALAGAPRDHLKVLVEGLELKGAVVDWDAPESFPSFYEAAARALLDLVRHPSKLGRRAP